MTETTVFTDPLQPDDDYDPKTIAMDIVVALVRVILPEVPVSVQDTGGGTMCVLMGSEYEHDGEEYLVPVMAGPGWKEDIESFAHADDFSVNYDINDTRFEDATFDGTTFEGEDDPDKRHVQIAAEMIRLYQAHPEVMS